MSVPCDSASERSRSLEALALSILAAAVLAAPRALGAAEDDATWHWGRDREFDLTHVSLSLRLDPREPGVRGSVRLEMTPLGDELDHVTLDCTDLVVDAVTSGDGSPLEFRRTEGVLQVDLDRPRSRGDRLAVAVSYHGRPDRGLYWVRPDRAHPHKPYEVWSQSEMEDARAWWPTWDYPDDRASSGVRVTVPPGFTAVSNGRLVSVEEDDDGWRTFVWRMEIPHVTYLTSVAVGQWDEAEDEWDGIPLHYYVPPGRKGDIQRTFADTPDMIAFFSRVTGRRYPYPRYSQVAVDDFIYGGMENISATTLTADTLHDERADVDYPSTGLVAHELAHQWFGDLLTCESWAHTWLNEGFATYFAALYIEHKKGRDDFLLELDGMRRAAVAADLGKSRRPVVAWRYRDPFDLFDAHAYQKGGMVLHMLRDLLGDEEFYRAIALYVRTHEAQTVDTGDFQDAVEASSGRALEWFFRQWLRRPGQPDLHASWDWDRSPDGEGGNVTVRVEQTQEDADGEPPFRFPLTVRTVHLREDGGVLREDHRLEVHDKSHVFVIPQAVRPDAVVLDPEGALLATLDEGRGRQEWAFLLEHGDNALVRSRAAEALAKKGPAARVSGVLATALRDDPHYAVRAAAAKALGEVRGDDAREALLEALDHEDDSRARRAAARALGRFPEDGAVAARLEDLVRRDPSYAVRADAVRALGEMRGGRAWPFLRRALAQDSHREVVRDAVWDAARRAHATSAIPEGMRWLGEGHPSRARRAALGALGSLGAEREMRDRRPIRERIEDLLEGDPDMFVRAAAAEALGNLGDPEAEEALRSASASDSQERVRRAARRAGEALQASRAEREERADILRRLEAVEKGQGEIEKEVEALKGRLGEAAPEEEKATP